MAPSDQLLRQAVELEGSDVRLPPARHRWLTPVGVHVDGEDLVYDHAKSRRCGGELLPSKGMLREFLLLAGADGQRIADYATEHGVLGLCEHGAPHTYCTEVEEDGTPSVDNPADREPLDSWRFYARLAATTMRAAHTLRQGAARPMPTEDLDLLLRWGTHGQDTAADVKNTVEGGRQGVAHVCTRWLLEADARLVMAWDARATLPQLTIGAPVPDAGMFAGLGLQVALACARSDGVAICDGCGGLHAPTRQPRPGQRTYCADCRRDRVPQRHADRDRRKRRQETAAKERRPR